jgi:hypothetical protein
MTVRSRPRAPHRTRDTRPPTATLLQKPLSEWYAEWKARKADALATTRQVSEPDAAVTPGTRPGQSGG